MKQLSTVLSSIQTGSNQQEQEKSLSVTPQHGLINVDGKMTIKQIASQLKPREQAITLERARLAWDFLRQLKSLRKRVRKWNETTQEWVYLSEYPIPEGMTHETVQNGLIEMLKPCSPTVTAHFVRLQACKPFYEADEYKIKVVFEVLLDTLKDYPEVCVILALSDLCTSDGRYFPEIARITKETEIYADLLKDVVDFFN